MKVVQVNAVYGVASTGRIVKGINDLAAQEGIEAYAAYSQGRAEGENVFHFGSKREQKIHALLSRITGLQGYFSKRGTRELLKKLDEIKPDVVHLHNLHSNNINLKMLLTYLAKKNIATVLTLHDCWFFTGKCCHFTMAKCDGYQKKCGHCPNLKVDIRSYFFDRSRKMLLDKKKWFSKIPRLSVVGVSDWVRDNAKQSVVFREDVKFRTIYNGIDIEKFVPTKSRLKAELGVENKFVVLGLSAGLDKRKGYDDFLALAKILSEDAVLVLAGLSKERIANLPEGILGLERTGDVKRLTEIYTMADVFVNPTHEDTFGLVNVEALACGTPVVTYHTGGCPEIIDESCGIVVDCGDVSGLKDAIARVKESPFDISACRTRALKFKQEERYQEYVNLYREMAEK